MAATISINPGLTTNARGSFNVQSLGFIQGMALDDPAIRNALAGGYLGSAETIPMWGGVAVRENIAAVTESRGPEIIRAATNALITGFSVFNQNHAAINTPQSPVPLTPSGMLVNFYRLGSGARIPLKIDPALVSLEGSIITTQVSWDFVNQRIIAYDAGVGALDVRALEVAVGNSLTVTFDAETGFATWDTGGTVAIALI